MIAQSVRMLTFVALLAVAGQAQADCRWTGELHQDGTPDLVNCKPDVEHYVAREHQCRVAKKHHATPPEFCAHLFDERAALYRAYADKDDSVHLTVGTYLNSKMVDKEKPEPETH